MSDMSKGDEWMIRRLSFTCIIIISIFLLLGCNQEKNEQQIKGVGLLVPKTVNDQVWGTVGYKGMLDLQSKFNVKVYYKESVQTESQVEHAIEEFEKKGVNLIFGHGDSYSYFFNEVADKYPSIHFVSFNGNAKKENVTNFSFKSYAMGFFGGMVAGHMTKTNKVGIIAAFDWQPEVMGFADGVRYENPQADVQIKFVQHWDDVDLALTFFNELLIEDIDVFYPAGDLYNVPIIEKVKEHGLYAIGYVSDQSYLGEQTVLTSTVQHVDKLYELAAKKFNEGTLSSGNIYVDFQDDVISLGKFSSQVDKPFQKKINQLVNRYKKTGKLPNEN